MRILFATYQLGLRFSRAGRGRSYIEQIDLSPKLFAAGTDVAELHRSADAEEESETRLILSSLARLSADKPSETTLSLGNKAG